MSHKPVRNPLPQGIGRVRRRNTGFPELLRNVLARYILIMSTSTAMITSAAPVVDAASFENQVAQTQAQLRALQVPVDIGSVGFAQNIVITDETFGLAEQQMVVWKESIKQKMDRWNPVCNSAFETHRQATGARAADVKPLEDACKILSAKLGDYLAEQQKARAEALRLETERAKQLVLTEREEVIEQAEESGATPEEVAALCAAPVAPIVLSKPRSTPGSSPVGLRQTYKGRLTNHLALAEYIVKNPQFLELIPVSESALNKLAATFKGKLELPGVQFYAENGTATRTKGGKS